MSRKILFSILVIVGVIVVTFVVAKNSDLLFRAALIKNPTQATLQNRKIQNIIDLDKKEFAAIRSSVQKKKKNAHDGIEIFIKKEELSLASYQKKIKTASAEEKERLLHLFDHERFPDKIAYIKKMAELPKILDSVSVVAAAGFKDAKKLQSGKLTAKERKSLQDIFQSTQEKMAQWKKAYAKEQPLEDISIQIQEWRSKVYRDIFTLKKTLMGSSNDPDKNMLKKLEELSAKIIFDIPYHPSDEIALPKSPAKQKKETDVINVTVCLMRWQSDSPPISLSVTRSVMAVVKEYFKDVSYGKTTFNVKHAGNRDWSGDIMVPADATEELMVAVSMCDQDIDFSKLDALVVYPSLLIDYGGLGGVRSVFTDEGEFRIGAVWIRSDAFFSPLIVHELGHAVLRLAHANKLACNGVAFADTGCSEIEYGNPFDIMGRGYYGGGSFSAWFKAERGWLKQQEIALDGTYRLGVLETASELPQLLRIPFPENPLCIEYRKPIGIDSDFVGSDTASPILPEGGCFLVNICSFNAAEGRTLTLIDLLPSSLNENYYDDFNDACLSRSETFSNNELGINLSFEPLNDSSVDVRIDLDETKL